MDAGIPEHSPHHPRITTPCGVQIGGIGTGRIELRPDGRFGIIQLDHSPQHLLGGYSGCFAWIRRSDQFRILEKGGRPGIPGCDAIDYEGHHPVAELRYAIAGMPIGLALTAFSPLVPHDVNRSSVPGVVLRFSVRNLDSHRHDLELGLSWENMLGCGGIGPKGETRRLDRTGNIIAPWKADDLGGLFFSRKPSDETDPAAAARNQGRMILACPQSEGVDLSVWSFWNILRDAPDLWQSLIQGAKPSRLDAGPLDEVLKKHQAKTEGPPPSWDDPDPRFGGGRTGIEGYVHPAAVLSASFSLAPDEQREVVFFITWHSPHHHTLSEPKLDHGRFYENQFDGPEATAAFLARHHPALLADTNRLSEALHDSDLPEWFNARLINDLTTLTTNQYITRDRTLWTLEASPQMWGSLGTLDQRLVSHIATSLFYPDLNRTELDVFARLQGEDGRMMHFSGNTHHRLGDGTVGYGDTGWPDLAMSFIVQAYRDWTESGEERAAGHWEPTVLRAFDWLVSCDQDGDGIPEGGSSWDIEHYGGCFIPTATLWLATLRIMEAWHAERKRSHEALAIREMLSRAQASVDRMWLGEYFAKVMDPTTHTMSDDCFIGQLEGQWVCDQLGLEPVIDRTRAVAAARSMMQRNGNSDRYRLPPIQVQADGTLPDRKYAWHAWPPYASAFLHAQAIYLGLGDQAITQVRAMDRTLSRLLDDPWASTIWYDARTGLPDFDFFGRDWYMSSPATWWVLAALTGVTERAHQQQLVLGPWMSNRNKHLRYPVFTSRWWGQMEIHRQDHHMQLKLRITQTCRNTDRVLDKVRFRDRLQQAQVTIDDKSIDAELLPTGIYTDIRFSEPISWKQSLCLEYVAEP